MANFLTQKAGPLPVWAWGAVGGGLFFLWRKEQAGAAAATTSTAVTATAPTTSTTPASASISTANGTDTFSGDPWSVQSMLQEVLGQAAATTSTSTPTSTSSANGTPPPAGTSPGNPYSGTSVSTPVNPSGSGYAISTPNVGTISNGAGATFNEVPDPTTAQSIWNAGGTGSLVYQSSPGVFQNYIPGVTQLAPNTELFTPAGGGT
jgi:hypothetical protein